MKLSESLQNIGRPLAYYASLALALRSVNAAIFLCQIFYWSDKTTDERGVYKSMKELEMETGLSDEEQKTARKKLRGKGILLETYVRLDHKMYYKIALDALDRFYDDYLNSLKNNQTGNHGFGKPGMPRSGKPESPVRETGNPVFAKAEIPCSFNEKETTTEITSETTTTTEATANDKAALTSIKRALLSQGFTVTDEKLLSFMAQYGLSTVLQSAEYTAYRAAEGHSIDLPYKYLDKICGEIVQGTFQPGKFVSSAERAERQRQDAQGKITKLERSENDRASPDVVKRDCAIIRQQGGLYGE